MSAPERNSTSENKQPLRKLSTFGIRHSRKASDSDAQPPPSSQRSSSLFSSLSSRNPPPAQPRPTISNPMPLSLSNYDPFASLFALKSSSPVASSSGTKAHQDLFSRSAAPASTSAADPMPVKRTHPRSTSPIDEPSKRQKVWWTTGGGVADKDGEDIKAGGLDKGKGEAEEDASEGGPQGKKDDKTGEKDAAEGVEMLDLTSDGWKEEEDAKGARAAEQPAADENDLADDDEESEVDGLAALFDPMDGVYRCAEPECLWEVYHGECQRCGTKHEVSEAMAKLDAQLDYSNETHIGDGEDDRQYPTAAADSDGAEAETDMVKQLLAAGATEAMVARYSLIWCANHGIIAIADAALRNLFDCHPFQLVPYPAVDGLAVMTVKEKCPWKIHLGQRVQLQPDDKDGRIFMEELLDEIVDEQDGGEWVTAVEEYELLVQVDDSDDEGMKEGFETRVVWTTRRIEAGEEFEDVDPDEEFNSDLVDERSDFSTSPASDDEEEADDCDLDPSMTIKAEEGDSLEDESEEERSATLTADRGADVEAEPAGDVKLEQDGYISTPSADEHPPRNLQTPSPTSSPVRRSSPLSLEFDATDLPLAQHADASAGGADLDALLDDEINRWEATRAKPARSPSAVAAEYTDTDEEAHEAGDESLDAAEWKSASSSVGAEGSREEEGDGGSARRVRFDDSAMELVE
ncbi:hypothetical protein JCM10207_008161 [Rhodosporidiobolus poonsookiae]